MEQMLQQRDAVRFRRSALCEIGRGLHGIFDSTLDLKVPPSLMEILAKLDANDELGPEYPQFS